MKTITFLLMLAFASEALALYDFAAIDIKPEDEQISFCLEYDTQIQILAELYFADNFYIAAVTKPGDILFVEPTAEAFTTTPWLPGDNAPIFSQWRNKTGPICLGPFPKSGLQDIAIYAGIGNDIDDALQRNNILKVFDGFPELPQPEKTWTVLVYMVGSDLEVKPNGKGKHWASKDILEMLAGTAVPNTTTNLVISTGGSTRNGWNTVKRTFIQNGQVHVLEDLGAKNMADPQTLSDFVIWAKANFPAQHHALILWNHGGGTQGYGLDTSPSGNGAMMDLNQLHQAYQMTRQQLEKPLDIVVYDACLMASIEVAQITATVANAMASSVELEPGHGIDYAHLMNNLGASPPFDGPAFGSVVKTGYIEHTKKEGTFEKSQITYSVFDLTRLPSFTETFSKFALKFNELLKQKEFLNYQTLSRGIIRAPGYPLIETGRLRSLRSVAGGRHIRIDLYNLLQTVGPDFDEFSETAQALLAILDQMVVDYETNDKVQKINPEAGRISLDINITNTAHLLALPNAYTLFNKGLVYYDERRQRDTTILDRKLVCLNGEICADAQWLELQADKILGIEAYFGQRSDDVALIYVIDPAFYQYRDLTETLDLNVDGHQACQYQLCVNEASCEDITLTKQENQLLADVLLNESPAVLSFCQADDGNWSVCGVAQQVDGVWGRDDLLIASDSIVPNTLHMIGPSQELETEQRQGNALIVDNPAQVTLKKSCDIEKAAIWAMYYGLNQLAQTALLCDNGDCVCKEGDTDEGCKEIGFKAGVYLKPLNE
jgi:hypothetical protein